MHWLVEAPQLKTHEECHDAEEHYGLNRKHAIFLAKADSKPTHDWARDASKKSRYNWHQRLRYLHVSFQCSVFLHVYEVALLFLNNITNLYCLILIFHFIYEFFELPFSLLIPHVGKYYQNERRREKNDALIAEV